MCCMGALHVIYRFSTLEPGCMDVTITFGLETGCPDNRRKIVVNPGPGRCSRALASAEAQWITGRYEKLNKSLGCLATNFLLAR